MQPQITVINPIKESERTIRAAAYVRVSTSKEDQLNSFAAQYIHYKKMIEESNSEELVDVYADEGTSGTATKNRDAFNRLMEDCEKGKINRIYLNGKSFAAIAKELTEKKVDYFQGKTAWNKQMVKRILESPMYCGTDKYPKIIDSTQFQAVAKLIASKYGGYNTDPRATVLKKRSFCQECGERIWHDVQSKQYRKWRCKKCAKTVLGDESFYQGVTDILNEVIRHPELLDEIEPQDTYESEYRLTAKTKEVNQLISSPSVNFDTAFEDILNLASLKYDNCEYDISEELTDTIKRDYLNRKLLEDVDNELIEHTVSHITVDSHGKITIHFINGAKVKAKGETNGSTQN